MKATKNPMEIVNLKFIEINPIINEIEINNDVIIELAP